MEDFTTNTGQNKGQESIPSPERPASQPLGIAALITAIVTFVIAVIPCVGIIALVPGIISIVLAGIGLSQASRNDKPRGILVAALIIGIVATLISFSQIFFVGKIGDKFDKEWGGRIENVIDEVQKNVIDEIQDANVSIKIENGNDTVEINVATRKSRQQELEELEKSNTLTNDTLEKKDQQ